MKLNWLKALFLSLLFSSIICSPVIFGGRNFFFGDNYHLVIPQKIFFVNQIKNGVLPFWNPYILSGAPFFADINQAIFYPSTLFFILLPIESALPLTIFSHLVIAGLGLYYFSKILKNSDDASFIAMAIWMFSQPLLMSINHVNITLLQVYSWLPWILGSFILIARDGNRKAALLMPCLLTLAILGGHPQPLLYLIFPGLLYFLFNRKIIKKSLQLLLPGLFTAFLMTIFVTFPFVELFQLSTRSKMGSTEVLNDSINYAHYIDLIIPNFFSDPSNGLRWGIYWTEYRRAGIYITWFGLLSLISTIFRKRLSRDFLWLLSVSVLTLILALGLNLPLMNWLVQHVASFQAIRNYSLILIMWPLTISILVGKSVEQILKNKHSRIIFLGLMLFLSSVLLYVITHYYFPHLWISLTHYIPQLLHSTFHSFDRDLTILNHISSNLLYSSVFFLLIILSIKYLSVQKKLFIVFALIVVDMYSSAKPILVFGNSQIYNYKDNPIVDFFNSTVAQDYRIVSSSGFFPYTSMPDYWANAMIQPPFAESSYDDVEKESNSQLIDRRNVFGSNWNMPYQLQSPFGTSAFILDSTATYWKSNNSRSFNINEVDIPEITDFRLTDQGVKYVIVDKTVFQNELPVGLNKMKALSDTPKWVILENSDFLPTVRFANTQGEVIIKHTSTNDMFFQTVNQFADQVLIKVAYYPGWKCYIDNSICTIMNDGFTMKINVPEGIHDIRIEFVPTGWPYLLFISSASWIIYLVILIKQMKYEKN